MNVIPTHDGDRQSFLQLQFRLIVPDISTLKPAKSSPPPTTSPTTVCTTLLLPKYYQGITTNEGGPTSLLPTDRFSFAGRGDLRYRIGELAWSRDCYASGQRPIFAGGHVRGTQLRQRGERSRFDSELISLGWRLGTAFGSYGSAWNTAISGNLDYTYQNTFTTLPPLGRYRSHTLTVGGDLSTFLPDGKHSDSYRKVIARPSVNLSASYAAEKGRPDFALRTAGGTVGISQQILPATVPVTVSFTYGKSRSVSESKLFGSSTFDYSSKVTAVTVSPFAPLRQSTISFVKQLSRTTFDWRHTASMGRLRTAQHTPSPTGREDQLTLRLPVLGRFGALGLRYTARSIGGTSPSKGRTFAAGIELVLD